MEIRIIQAYDSNAHEKCILNRYMRRTGNRKQSSKWPFERDGRRRWRRWPNAKKEISSPFSNLFTNLFDTS